MAKTRSTAKHKDPHLRARQMFQEFMATDVDAQLFVFCAELYRAAASLAMPVENPENRPLVADGDKVYALSDRPMNRGMLAVMKELRLREERTRAIHQAGRPAWNHFRFRCPPSRLRQGALRLGWGVHGLRHCGCCSNRPAANGQNQP